MKLTLQEFCNKFHYKEITVKNNFGRTKEVMERKGWILTKDEEGNYIIEPKED